MIGEYGKVVRTTGDGLEVRVLAPGACDSCPIHDSCYSSGKLVWLPQQQGLGVDDYVRFSITNASVLKISALVYGLPLLGVLGGILVGYLWLFRSFASDPKTLLSVALGVALFLASGFLVSRLDSRIKNRLSYTITPAEPPSNTEA